eukprot:Selendium_serpulae@DN1702_c0_g1_i2.p1
MVVTPVSVFSILVLIWATACGVYNIAASGLFLKYDLRVAQTSGVISSASLGAHLGLAILHTYYYLESISTTPSYGGTSETTHMLYIAPFVMSVVSGALSLWLTFGIDEYRSTCRFNAFAAVVYCCAVLDISMTLPSLNDYPTSGCLGLLAGGVILALYYSRFRYSQISTWVLTGMIVLVCVVATVGGIMWGVKDTDIAGTACGADHCQYNLYTRFLILCSVVGPLVFKVFCLPEAQRPKRTISGGTAASGPPPYLSDSGGSLGNAKGDLELAQTADPIEGA